MRDEGKTGRQRTPALKLTIMGCCQSKVPDAGLPKGAARRTRSAERALLHCQPAQAFSFAREIRHHSELLTVVETCGRCHPNASHRSDATVVLPTLIGRTANVKRAWSKEAPARRSWRVFECVCARRGQRVVPRRTWPTPSTVQRLLWWLTCSTARRCGRCSATRASTRTATHSHLTCPPSPGCLRTPPFPALVGRARTDSFLHTSR